jgi:hypothetical protein
MLLALLCGSLLAAAPGARAAAAVVPAQMDAALLLDGSQAAAGLRAFLDGVAQRAPALAPGPRIAGLVGPDLLAQPLAWGLAFSGPRALVLWRGSVALTAPVRDAKAARASLHSWLEELGRTSRPASPRVPAVSQRGKRIRAGMVAPAGRSLRLFSASGPEAPALVSLLARIGAPRGTAPLAWDLELRDALAHSSSPATVVVRGAHPLRAAVLSLSGTPRELVARGQVIATSPLLVPEPPGTAACQGTALFCVRAALGPGGRALLSRAARAWLSLLLAPEQLQPPDRIAQAAALAAARVVLRSDGADARLLAGDREAPWAVRLQGATAPGPGVAAAAEIQGPRSLCLHAEAGSAWFATPCTDAAPADLSSSVGPDALDGYLDLATLDAALSKVTPIDALRGSIPATVYAARLLLGNLLRASGPLHLTGKPHPAGAEVELHWPLR